MSAAYTVDGGEGGCRNLNDLICEVRFELPMKGEDDTRPDNLLRIARDLAEGLLAKDNLPSPYERLRPNGFLLV